MMAAESGSYLENITLNNIQLNYPYIDPPGPLALKANSLGFFKTNPEVRTAYSAIVARRVKNLVISSLTISWPENNVPDNWNLFNTEWRFLNKEIYKGPETDKALKDGTIVFPYHCFWGMDLEGGWINAVKLKSNSRDTDAVKLTNSETFRVIE
jgi:hypothetical protein